MKKKQTLKIFKDNLEKEDPIIKNVNKLYMNKKKLLLFKTSPENYLKSLNEDEMVDLIQYLNYKYYAEGESLVSDELYDLVKEKLKNKNINHPILKEVGITTIHKVDIPYYMGSMDKIKNNEKTLNNWLKKYKDEDYILSDKLDGVSCLLNYVKNTEIKLYTRGNGKTGQDISYLLKFINYIPNIENSMEDITVRGELIITKENFIKIKETDNNIKNIRNAVAGIINAKKPNLKITKYIDFVSYECIRPDNLNPMNQFKKLKKLGFKTAYAEAIPKINVKVLSNRLVDRREKGKYEIDGIIVSHNKYYKRVSDENPKYSFAFKSIITSKKAEVLVLKVEWNLTKDDYLQPVVLFEPVEINGVTIQKATGINGKFINDNNIGPGSIITIIRSGDVIPKIEEILKSSQIGKSSMPQDYKWKWNETKIEIMLDDNQDNQDIVDEKSLKELENFVLKIKFNRISTGIIKKLHNGGIKNISNFLNITKDELIRIDGIKDKSADNILKSIKESMDNLDCVTLMVASNKLGRGFADKKLRLIVNTYPDIINENRKPEIDELIKINGIEKKTAEKFIQNFDKYLEFIKTNNIKCIYKKPKSKVINNKLTNQKIVLTGFRDNELQNNIEENDGIIQSTINKETTLLIIKNKEATGSKIEKAKELNIKIITLDNFKSKFMKL
tara:strand:+ start:2306 stop:4321 length:2016 start_codon:yes stop_codon:yes gene_type:complete